MYGNLQAIEAAFMDAAVDPSRWSAAMEAASTATGSFGAALFPIKGRIPELPHSRSLAASFETYVRDGWIHRDERYRAWPAAERRGVATDLDFTTEDAMAREPYYQEFLAPHGLRWAAIIRIDNGEDCWALSLQRTIAQGPFSEAEQRRLIPLSRSLSAAAILARILGLERAASALEAFSVNGAAVVMFDRAGDVLLINEAAERLLGTDLQVHRKRLVWTPQHGITVALDRALHSLCWNGGVPACAQPIVLKRRQGRPIVAYPMRLAGACGDALAPCRALVVLVDLDAHARPSSSILHASFGLTPAEARLAGLLISGDDLDAVADQLGICKETARSHLKAIFAKTGTGRQGELIALLAKLSLSEPGSHPYG